MSNISRDSKLDTFRVTKVDTFGCYTTPNWLEKNIEKKFEVVVKKINSTTENPNIKLDFRLLKAGLGGHLFNKIARDILSSDITVFEVSNANCNVYLEMGVALTWGIEVVPIKKYGKPKPASDIMGLTYLDYTNDSQYFVDEKGNPSKEKEELLLELVERVIKKKVNP